MKLGVFVNDYGKGSDTLDRIKSDGMGIILVQNGIYYAALKENGQASPVLSASDKIYALTDDVQSRGIDASAIDKKVKLVDYEGLVDLIFNEFDKVIWI